MNTNGKSSTRRNTKTGDGGHRSDQGLYTDALTPRVREVPAMEGNSTIKKALGARPKEGSLVKSWEDIGMGHSGLRSSSTSKGRTMPPPAPPGCGSQGGPMGNGRKNRRGIRERDRVKMEGSLRAWLSQAEKPVLEDEGKRRKEGGLSGERDELNPTARSPSSTRDRPQDQSRNENRERGFTDDTGDSH